MSTCQSVVGVRLDQPDWKGTRQIPGGRKPPAKYRAEGLEWNRTSHVRDCDIDNAHEGLLLKEVVIGLWLNYY